MVRQLRSRCIANYLHFFVTHLPFICEDLVLLNAPLRFPLFYRLLSHLIDFCRAVSCLVSQRTAILIITLGLFGDKFFLRLEASRRIDGLGGSSLGLEGVCALHPERIAKCDHL